MVQNSKPLQFVIWTRMKYVYSCHIFSVVYRNENFLKKKIHLTYGVVIVTVRVDIFIGKRDKYIIVIILHARANVSLRADDPVSGAYENEHDGNWCTGKKNLQTQTNKTRVKSQNVCPTWIKSVKIRVENQAKAQPVRTG